MDPVVALQKWGGAARRPGLRSLGVSDYALRTSVARGSVLRAGVGGYSLQGAPEELVRAVELGGVVSHKSAAKLHGCRLWTPPTVLEVTVPRNTHRVALDARVHRADVSELDLEPLRAMTGIERTLLDCGRTLSLLEALIIFDGALHARWVGPSFLRRAAAFPAGPGSGALRRVLAHVDGLADSALESVLRLLLSLLHCDLRSQVWIRGVGKVDFLLDGWLGIEADGYEFHRERADFRKDRSRGNQMVIGGKVVLRFTWEDVKSRPFELLSEVAAVLAKGPPWS